MTYVLGTAQRELRDTVRRFLEKEAGMPEVRRLIDSEKGYDQAFWAQACDQLGLSALAIPEKFGGAGYGPVELMVVLEEMGAALLGAPFFSTAVMAASLLLATHDDSAKYELLPGIANGRTLAAVAVPSLDGCWDVDQTQVVASRVGSDHLLDGQHAFILDGQLADVLIVCARSESGPSLFAVDCRAAGLRQEPMSTVDLTRRQTRASFSAVPGRLIGSEGDAFAAVARAFPVVLAAQAAEQVGGARRCLEMATDYAKVRTQFGRPIGSFQAIKHKCADMLVKVELARSAAHAAAVAADEEPARLPLAASLAAAYCSDAYTWAAGENIQIHGGIGFTWEHDAHLYYRRAVSSQVMLGTPTQHRDRVAGHLLAAG